MDRQQHEFAAKTAVRSYHLREGWYFDRLEDGEVRVRTAGGAVVTMAPEEWASVVASMSHRGEDYTTYRLAYVAQMGPLA